MVKINKNCSYMCIVGIADEKPNNIDNELCEMNF